MLEERDSSGEVTAEYTQGYTPVKGIGSLVGAKQNVSGATYYQFPVYDHRGTVYRLTDENGNVIADYQYNAWGQVLEESEEVGASGNRFRYQSNWIELKDSQGRFVLSPARVYSALEGRFLQRDPKGYVDSFNLYESFAGGPLGIVDPNGREFVIFIKSFPATKSDPKYKLLGPGDRKQQGGEYRVYEKFKDTPRNLYPPSPGAPIEGYTYVDITDTLPFKDNLYDTGFLKNLFYGILVILEEESELPYKYQEPNCHAFSLNNLCPDKINEEIILRDPDCKKILTDLRDMGHVRILDIDKSKPLSEQVEVGDVIISGGNLDKNEAPAHSATVLGVDEESGKV